jgi:hypothetical protein
VEDRALAFVYDADPRMTQVGRLLKAAVCGVAALVATGAAANTVEDAQVWTTLSTSGSIKGDIVGQIDLNARTSVDQGRVTQSLMRGTIGYRVTPVLTLSLGYGHITGFRRNQRDLAEERLYQQVQATLGTLGDATVSTRIRLEQRFVRPGSDVGWRYRQLVRVQIPLRQAGPAIVVQAEPFFALNSTDWGARAGFDQVRTMMGVNVPIAKSFTIESGYQLQYVRGAASDRLNHIVPITLSWRF